MTSALTVLLMSRNEINGVTVPPSLSLSLPAFVPFYSHVCVSSFCSGERSFLPRRGEPQVNLRRLEIRIGQVPSSSGRRGYDTVNVSQVHTYNLTSTLPLLCRALPPSPLPRIRPLAAALP